MPHSDIVFFPTAQQSLNACSCSKPGDISVSLATESSGQPGTANIVFNSAIQQVEIKPWWFFRNVFSANDLIFTICAYRFISKAAVNLENKKFDSF